MFLIGRTSILRVKQHLETSFTEGQIYIVPGIEPVRFLVGEMILEGPLPRPGLTSEWVCKWNGGSKIACLPGLPGLQGHGGGKVQQQRGPLTVLGQAEHARVLCHDIIQ